MADASPTPPTTPADAPRRPWAAPAIKELPKLTDLTLASLIGGGGGTGGGGSTVFGLLLSVGLLAGCSADQLTEPGVPETPKPIAAVPCVANVELKVVACGGPFGAPGQEILGGQGYHLVLRSTNVAYDGTDFTFDVTIQNLSSQTIGTDGTSASGLSVFFVQEPVATSGSGTITVQNALVGTFTAANQSYYGYNDTLPYLSISAPASWSFAMAPTVTTFAFTVMVAADVGDQGGVLKWQEVAGLGFTPFNDVASSGPNDAVAVSYAGMASRWDGSDWTPIPSTTADELDGIAAIAPGEYVVAGDSGRLYRLKGKIWTLIHDRPDTRRLKSIFVRSGGSFVAAGDGGAVTWYSGGVFTDEVVDPFENFVTVTGTADGSLTTVVTETVGGLSYTASGVGAWGVGDSLVTADEVVTDIAYDADNKLLLAYANIVSFEGVILHDGIDTVYFRVAELPFKLYPFARDSLVTQVVDFIAGGTYLNKVRHGAAPVHANFTFTDTIADQVVDGTALNAAQTEFILSNNAFTLWVKDGGPFTEVVTSLSCGCFSGMWGIEDTVYVVDGTTTLWKVVDGVRTALSAPPGAYTIWGLSSTELYVTADSTLWKGDGVGAWTQEFQFAGNGDLFGDIWGDAASGNLIALADGGRWFTRVSGAWNPGDPLGMNVSGVWGCSGSQAWIVSQNGGIFNWDGGTGATADPNYTYATWFHRDVTGTSCSDVWVSGPSNELFHWNGATWDSLFAPGDLFNIYASVAKGPGQVYIGGDDGMAAIATATGGFLRIPVPNQGGQIIALWPLLNGELISVDEEHVMRGVR
jgi:hypothetical protein